MAELLPPLYTDAFDLTLSPWGGRYAFGVRLPISNPQKGQPPQTQLQQTTQVFMSLEHLKALVIISAREILRYERQVGFKIPLPSDVVKSLGMTVEEYNKFWYGWKSGKPFGPSELQTGTPPVLLDGQEEPVDLPFTDPAKV